MLLWILQFRSSTISFVEKVAKGPFMKRTEYEIGGFQAIRLANESVALVVVPDLGAKIVSLKNVRSGREWCWHPGDTLELFANEFGDSFGDSTHVGIDECFPTVEECEWNGRSLPCHGEVWSDAWVVKDEPLEECISTQVRLRRSPFTLQRKISFDGNAIRLDYTLKNDSDFPESYIWALHPFFRVGPGDRLVLPAEVDHLTLSASNGFPIKANTLNWPSPFPGFHLDRFDLGENRVSRLKAFTSHLERGQACIVNDDTNDFLKMIWDTQDNPCLGVWMTRGGYRDIQYVAALEPTNASCDSLAHARPSEHTILPAGGRRNWSVHFQLG